MPLGLDWFAYSLGIIPAIGLVYSGERRKFWVLVALAFAVSFVADTSTLLGAHPWAVTYFYPGVQLTLIIWALVERFEAAVVLSLAVVAVSTLSLLQGPWGTPEMVTTVGGGLLVAGLATLRDDLGHLKDCIVWWFGVGAVAYALWPLTFGSSEAFFVAYAAFVVAHGMGVYHFVRSLGDQPRLAYG